MWNPAVVKIRKSNGENNIPKPRNTMINSIERRNLVLAHTVYKLNVFIKNTIG